MGESGFATKFQNKSHFMFGRSETDARTENEGVGAEMNSENPRELARVMLGRFMSVFDLH